MTSLVGYPQQFCVACVLLCKKTKCFSSEWTICLNCCPLADVTDQRRPHSSSHTVSCLQPVVIVSYNATQVPAMLFIVNIWSASTHAGVIFFFQNTWIFFLMVVSIELNICGQLQVGLWGVSKSNLDVSLCTWPASDWYYERSQVLMEGILQRAATASILLWRKQWKRLSVIGCTQCVSTPEGTLWMIRKSSAMGETEQVSSLCNLLQVFVPRIYNCGSAII